MTDNTYVRHKGKSPVSRSTLKNEFPFIPYKPETIDAEQGLVHGERLYQQLKTRRSIRHFSNKPVPKEMIEHAILCASTVPSGAHR